MEIQDLYTKQKEFFNTNQTKDIDFRIDQLKKIRRILKESEEQIFQAIYDDFGKSRFETYATELSLLYHELNVFIKKIRRWSSRIQVSTNLANTPAKSYIIPEPLGTTLVIGAWNYPVQLALIPAITSLAAGNTVMLKPSELPSRTSQVLAKMINEHFPSHYFSVIEGGVETTTKLLEHRYDKIFFTGSTRVGKIIYQAAAKHLTPVTLELGGKCPTFVLADCHIKLTAKRIVWAKFLNAGQTCIAPDYILAEDSIEGPLIDALKNEIDLYHQNSEDIAENYLRIINTAHFDRLTKLIDHEKVCYGGSTNRQNRFISPTLLKDISFEDQVMEDEIFGPILPILTFKNLDKAIEKVKERPKPLACYIYSRNKKRIDKLLHEISFGGGAINDSIMHLSNSKLPFGGIGFSGMGNYHGKYGFDTFSHFKSILHKSSWFEPNIKYPPYTKGKLRLMKWLLE